MEDEAVTLEEVLRVVSSVAWDVRPGAEVLGRVKSLESRAGKMRRVGGARTLDCIGVRVIVGDIADCYAVVNQIHARFSFLEREYDDYVEWPKSNRYQSLHTTILASNGQPVEVQVRTRGMNAVAESGSASHRVYKQMSRIGHGTDARLGPRRHPAALVRRRHGGRARTTVVDPTHLRATGLRPPGRDRPLEPIDDRRLPG